MKKYASIALALVLTAGLFTGCGCTNRNTAPTTMPSVLPTTEPSRATTGAATAPTTHATVPSSETTTDRNNGGMNGTDVPNGTGDHNGTVGTETTEGNTRSRTGEKLPGGTAPRGR